MLGGCPFAIIADAGGRRMRSKIIALGLAALMSANAVGSELAEIVRQGLGAISPAAREKLAPTMVRWVAGFRDDAIERGVEEIPAEIRDALSGFVPADVLDDVRWRIDGETGFFGRSLFQIGSAHAITLDNVILFAGADEAADPGLWAHELYHVMQYRQWCIEGFITRYLADHSTVEHEAKEFRYRWWKATRWDG
jgi:hypothetical protein